MEKTITQLENLKPSSSSTTRKGIEKILFLSDSVSLLLAVNFLIGSKQLVLPQYSNLVKKINLIFIVQVHPYQFSAKYTKK